MAFLSNDLFFQTGQSYFIFKDFRTFEALNYIQEVLNSNSHLSAIVNRQRQIILSNQHLGKIAGLKNLEQIIGDRPGEILNCIHSTDKNVCGSSTSCKYCGIKRTIYTSQSQNKRVTGESRITARVDGKLMSYDFNRILFIQSTELYGKWQKSALFTLKLDRTNPSLFGEVTSQAQSPPPFQG